MKKITAIIAMVAAVFVATTASAQGGGSSHRVTPYVNTVNPTASARMANGIIIVGKPNTARALSPFGGSSTGAAPLAECGNYYKSMLGDGVNVYVAVIPLAAAFYTPNSARQWTKSQEPAINAMFAALKNGVKGVDFYSALAPHASEPIYSRTDHHWAPLAGYYAAEAFAKLAGVPFKSLANYDEVVVPNYVGSMHMYSKDAAVSASPEKFIYYKPRGIEYTTTYIVGEGRPTQGKYFYDMKGGGAYCTFMGGDNKITQVRTATKNGRRLIIVKDSFGNVLPGYLFYSFEEIHVIDFRYFSKNMKNYVKQHGITDILLTSNISFACSQNTMAKYRRFLVQ